ncbi:D-beta-hydroxybutyrate dehydrogenase, mitochondrial-like isoform X2 [Ostrea edulis]|uniref:D-beta-hydroxybutyrate dehydrogenase, mitochondrial-like isoform X2 n=1 Tax=Ostrea edulis TaxID=37623 RepID=UPI0024AF097A|nr:D-beta-hydroxybutyrate dehydrogenase, mitochondrial-like isoform X2 [Ostrea edulis]
MFVLAGVVALIACLFFLYGKTKSIRRIKIHGQGVLITGCDTGFGHQLVQRLDEMGFTVFAGCLSDKSQGAETLKRICTKRVHILQLDVTKSEDILQARKTVQKGCAAPGRIVNVTSVKGVLSRPTISVYGATKFGAENFSDCLRLEMRKFGVKVSIIEPGNFGGLTGIVKDQNLKRLMNEMEIMWEHAEDDVKQAYGRAHLEGQFTGLHKALETCSPTMKPVIDALEDALVNERPSVRYLVDGGRGLVDWYNLYARIHYYLPSKWMDFVLDTSWNRGIR